MRESRRAGRGDACADRRRARSDRLVEGEYDGVRRAYAGLDGRSGWIGREREVECTRGPVHLTRRNTGDSRRGLRLRHWDDRDAGRDRQNGSRENFPLSAYALLSLRSVPRRSTSHADNSACRELRRARRLPSELRCRRFESSLGEKTSRRNMHLAYFGSAMDAMSTVGYNFRRRVWRASHPLGRIASPISELRASRCAVKNRGRSGVSIRC
jgi:hypothetical protein